MITQNPATLAHRLEPVPSATASHLAPTKSLAAARHRRVKNPGWPAQALKILALSLLCLLGFGVSAPRSAQAGESLTLEAGFEVTPKGNHSPDFGAVFAMALQPDGKILIGGGFHEITWKYIDPSDGSTKTRTEPRSHIARINQDGTLDEEFNPGADKTVYALAVLSDGITDWKIMVGGAFSTLGKSGATCPRINRTT